MIKRRIEQQGAITKVYFDDMNLSQKYTFLLSSDRHHDSAHCNRQLEKKHLDQAKEREAYIIDAGDLFDAMQGKFDPRRSYDDLRPEYCAQNYYDLIVDDAVEFYEPYAENFLMIGKGNHEAGAWKNANTDLVGRLTSQLRRAGSHVATGGFGGYVILYFNYNGKGNRSSIKLRYHHGGAGGNAPVTRGVIQTARQAVYTPDADIVLNGHNHQAYVVPIKRERISVQGKQYFDIAWYVRTPGYKDGYQTGEDGWSNEKMMSPTPQGCAWLEIEFEKVGAMVRPHCIVHEDVT